jgi:hypothetical protein
VLFFQQCSPTPTHNSANSTIIELALRQACGDLPIFKKQFATGLWWRPISTTMLFSPPPLSFYHLFRSICPLNCNPPERYYWLNRPLWTTLKWLLDYSPAGPQLGEQLGHYEEFTFFAHLFQNGNFAALTDQECDELWYYLVDHLGFSVTRSFDQLREQSIFPNRYASCLKFPELNAVNTAMVDLCDQNFDPNSIKSWSNAEQAAFNSVQKEVEILPHLFNPRPVSTPFTSSKINWIDHLYNPSLRCMDPTVCGQTITKFHLSGLLGCLQKQSTTDARKHFLPSNHSRHQLRQRVLKREA